MAYPLLPLSAPPPVIQPLASELNVALVFTPGLSKSPGVEIAAAPAIALQTTFTVNPVSPSVQAAGLNFAIVIATTDEPHVSASMGEPSSLVTPAPACSAILGQSTVMPTQNFIQTKTVVPKIAQDLPQGTLTSFPVSSAFSFKQIPQRTQPDTLISAPLLREAPSTASNTTSPLVTLTSTLTATTEDTAAAEVIEFTADRQEYDDIRRIFTGIGNVLMRFRGTELRADRLRINVTERTVVAQGNVTLTQGTQVIRRDRLQFDIPYRRGTAAIP